MPPDAPLPPPPAHRPPFSAVVLALGSEIRWRILAFLTHGEGRELGEIAGAVRHSKDNTVRHLAVLVKAGLVARGRGRLYLIPAERLPQRGQPLVDCGHCVLRLDGID